MNQPLVMNGKLFRDSIIIAGIAIVGSLFFALLFVGLWYWRVVRKNGRKYEDR